MSTEWERSEQYKIPSAVERDHSQRETKVKLTLEVTGGAIMDDQTIVFTFPNIRLNKPDQMVVELFEEDVSDISYDGVESLPPTPRHKLRLHLDPALLGSDDDLGGPTHYLEVRQSEKADTGKS